jgi:hypothetical protein
VTAEVELGFDALDSGGAAFFLQAVAHPGNPVTRQVG